MGQFMEEHSYACTETSAEADREGRSNCQTIGKVVSSVSKDDDPSNRDNTVAESCTEWLIRTYVRMWPVQAQEPKLFIVQLVKVFLSEILLLRKFMNNVSTSVHNAWTSSCM